MDSFNAILKEVMKNPTRGGLQMICSQVEAWENYMPSKVKEMAQRAVSVFMSDGTLAAEEDMLRLYRVLGKYSRKAGAVKVFEKLEQQGRFTGSLKFHLLWAEAYAESKDLNGFSRVLGVARSRLSYISIVDFEAGFRDIADKYFPDSEVFNDEEETMAVFNINRFGGSNGRKHRRRSSLATFEARAKDILKSLPGAPTAQFDAKSQTKLRIELIDRPEDRYMAPSLEEFRAAMHSVQQMGDNDDMLNVPMDITSTHEPETVPTSSQLQGNVSELKELGKRNRILETVEEVETEFSNDDKRRRIFSPGAPVRGASARETKKGTTQPSASSDFISGSSFTEKAYNDMKAVLSDTVDINKASLHGITDETTLPAVPPVVEAFEVYIDRDETTRVSEKKNDENATSRDVNLSRSVASRDPLHSIPLEVAAGDSDKTFVKTKGDVIDEFRRGGVVLQQKAFVIEDEETVAGAKFSSLGIDKKPHRGIVTSTPAHQMLHPPTHEDFFAPLNHELEKQMEEQEDEQQLYAQSAFMRRRSVAPQKSMTPAPKPAAPKARTVQAAERSMELALDKMKLGETHDDMKDDESGDDHDKTGVGLVMEAVTSAVNPWDRRLRMEILRKVPTPCYQHNFDTQCPRVSAGKNMNFGGETFNIVTLIGQGGFAKVYKAVNEDGKTMALKYEIPSCPWEVYICSEVKMRLGGSKRFTLESVMQVADAYVFTNASILFNEYHPYGTLLDLSNKLNDPSWYIVALIAIQIAKILRDVHSTKIIHGDVKPDNFMILRKLNETCEDVQQIVNTPILKLIDWGRAIDMRTLAGQTFRGRAGTDKFDCPEMLDGRPWTYQTDYFGFVGTLHVVIFNKYAEVENKSGVFMLKSTMKRRLLVRPILENIFEQFLNIPDCDHQPNWDNAVKTMEEFMLSEFAALGWRQAAGRFNQCLL